jgi:hypothetical protein
VPLVQLGKRVFLTLARPFDQSYVLVGPLIVRVLDKCENQSENVSFLSSVAGPFRCPILTVKSVVTSTPDRRSRRVTTYGR